MDLYGENAFPRKAFAKVAFHSKAVILLLLIEGKTVFKFFIWGDISSDIRSEI